MSTTTNSSSNAPVIDEDWEEWTPEKGSFLHHMVAGSAAGVAEHVSIFPIDTIKVRLGGLHSLCVCVCVCVSMCVYGAAYGCSAHG